MSKLKVDPTTGEPKLTYREQPFLDEFIASGGNGSRAAASAGYSPARPDQSAYQVLRRPEVQRLDVLGKLSSYKCFSPAP